MGGESKNKMTDIKSVQNSEDLPKGMVFTRGPIDDPYTICSACDMGTMYHCGVCHGRLGSNLDCDYCREYGETQYDSQSGN